MKNSTFDARRALSNLGSKSSSASPTLLRKFRRAQVSAAALLACFMLPPAHAQVIGANVWVGEVSSDWFNPANWLYGKEYSAPREFLQTGVGPLLLVGEGVPPNTYKTVPLREAVLNASFLTYGFRLSGWDGLSQVRIVKGGWLGTYGLGEYGGGSIGNDVVINVAGRPQQSANLILDGGNIAGSWQFFANSRIEVLSQYGQSQRYMGWSGTLGELAIAKGASFNFGEMPNLKINRVTNNGALVISSGWNTGLAFTGQITNNGTLTLAGGSDAPALLQVVGDTILTGTGTTVLAGENCGKSEGYRCGYVNGGASSTLTIGAGHTLRGSGYMGPGDLVMVNQGLIIADADLHLLLGSSRTLENSAGRIQVSEGAKLRVNGTLNGGAVQGIGSGGRIDGFYKDVTFLGNLNFKSTSYGGLEGNTAIGADAKVTVSDQANISAWGVIANNGVLMIGGGNGYGSGVFLTGDTKLAGKGSTVLLYNGYFSAGDGKNVTLTVDKWHTLRGEGLVRSGGFGGRLSVFNEGTISAESAHGLEFDMRGGSFINAGRINVTSDGNLNAPNQTLHQISSTAVTHVDGLLWLGTLDLAAGTLSGSGLIDGNVAVGAGVIAPGNSPGKLTITGDLALSNDSTLEMQVAGPTQGVDYDWLDVGGNVYFDGKLHLDFGAYKPKKGDSFEFLTVHGGVVSGGFDSIYATGYTLDTRFDGQHLTVTVASILAVPEPESYILMLGGLGAMGLVAGKRRRARGPALNLK